MAYLPIFLTKQFHLYSKTRYEMTHAGNITGTRMRPFWFRE